MTNLMKLSVIALLTGTLAIVGCGDDENGTGGMGNMGGGTGGSGGTGNMGGGTGGMGGGTGGMGGGTGGMGGGEPCEQTCGVGNEFPDGSPVGSADLNCSVMGIPIPLTFNLTAVASGDLMDGENDISVVAQTVIPTEVVDLIINLASDAEILSTTGDIDTTGTPAMVQIELADVPCLVCFEQGVEVVVTVDPLDGTFTVSGGSIDFTLSVVTVTINAAGLELVLSNGGDDPACSWQDDTPPSVTLSAPM